MASAAVSTLVNYNSPDVATQCGIVYCSQSFEDFLINCTTCSQEFNLLSCNLFINHIKEHHCNENSNFANTNTYMPPENGINMDNFLSLNNHLDPLLTLKVELDDVKEPLTIEDSYVEDVEHLSDYKDEDDLTIDKIARRNVIEEIIKEYKKHPLLWDESMVRRPGDSSIHYNQIREVINAKFRINITDSELRQKILRLRSGYKRAIKSKTSKLWYFPKMTFIEGTVDDIKKTDRFQSPKEELFANEQFSDSDYLARTPKTKKRNKTPNLSDRKMVLDIIHQYKKHPCLWTAGSPGCKKKSKSNAIYGRIASYIQAKYKISVSAKDVNTKIESLRNSWKRQARRNRQKDGSRVSLWYYDKLAFAFNAAEKDQKQQYESSDKSEPENVVRQAETKSESNTAKNELSDNDESNGKKQRINDENTVLTLIDEYKKHPCLWNNDFYKTSSNSYRSSAWQIITDALNVKFNQSFTIAAIRNKIRLLRMGYRRVSNSKVDFEKDQLNANMEFTTNVYYFERLSFIGTSDLDKTEQMKRNESDTSDNSDEEAEDNRFKPYKGSLTKNRELLTFIIEEYKKRPCLWSKKKFSTAEVRRKVFGKMAAIINEKFSTTFTHRSLTNDIRSLRYSYHRMLRGKQENPEYKTKMWYADMLSFIEEKNDDGEQIHENSNDDGADTDLGLTADGSKFQNEKYIFTLIDLYKETPILWDSNHPRFMSRNERRKHFHKIISDLREKHDSHLTFAELKYQIRYLRVTFFRALQKEFAAKEENFVKLPPKAYFHDRLSFLEPFANKQRVPAPLLQVDVKLDPSEHFILLTENRPLMMSFIQLYQEQGCLWNQNHKDFSSEPAQSDAYDKIINLFLQNDVVLTKERVISAISFLHAIVVSTHKASEAYDMPDTNKEIPWFYEHLKFLGKIPQEQNKFCNHCDKHFRTVAAYEKHKIKIGDYPFKCRICGKGFISRAKYQYHQIKHREPLKCDRCDFQAHCKQNFKVHMLRHQGITPFACENCHRRFVTTNELKRHLLTHTGEKLFVCDICGKKLSTNTLLNRHRRRHNNRRDHPCQVCGKAFFTSEILKGHMLTHSDERKHVCKTCGAAFKRKKTLYQHEALHAEKKNHACKICGQLFAQKAGVYSHMKTHDLVIGNS